MGEDSDPPRNPFIRWKQHVDTHIGVTLNGLLGIPAMVTKNLNLGRGPAGESGAPSEGSDSSSGPEQASSKPGAAPSQLSSQSSTPHPSSSQLQQQPNHPFSTSSPNPQSPSSSSSSAPKTPSADGDDGDGGDGALDGVDPAQLLAWHKFVYYSPYSPLKLLQQQQLHLLPPPVPRDVPPGADPYSFTYADAFEDLLRASSGRPLLDLADRSYRNLRFQMRYGSAVEPPYVLFHRLHSQRLLDAYFPRTAAAAAAPGETSEDTNYTADSPNDSVVQAVAALAERDRDLWREQQAAAEEADREYDYDDGDDEDEYDEDDEEDDVDEDEEEEDGQATRSGDPWNDAITRQPNPRRPATGLSGLFEGGLFDGLDRMFRVLGRIIDEDTGANAEREAREAKEGRDTTDKDVADDASGRQPTAEDELYAMVRSAYADAERSLGSLIKTFSGGSYDAGRPAPTPTQKASSDNAAAERNKTTEQRWSDEQDEGETIQTTEEHVDVFGNQHVKTTVRRLDADGREYSRETRYTIRSPTPEEVAVREIDSSDDNDQEVEEIKQSRKDIQREGKVDQNTKKPGWFWK